MRTIYIKYFCDDDMGEADAFYEEVDGKLELITAWSNNDAMYRKEYMRPLFKHLGVEINELPKKFEAKATKILKEAWGF